MKIVLILVLVSLGSFIFVLIQENELKIRYEIGNENKCVGMRREWELNDTIKMFGNGNGNEIMGIGRNGSNKCYSPTPLTQSMNERSNTTVDSTNH